MLGAYLLGALEPATSARLAATPGDCPDCAAEHAALGRPARLLVAAPPTGPRAALAGARGARCWTGRRASRRGRSGRRSPAVASPPASRWPPAGRSARPHRRVRADGRGRTARTRLAATRVARSAQAPRRAALDHGSDHRAAAGSAGLPGDRPRSTRCAATRRLERERGHVPRRRARPAPTSSSPRRHAGASTTTSAWFATHRPPRAVVLTRKVDQRRKTACDAPSSPCPIAAAGAGRLRRRRRRRQSAGTPTPDGDDGVAPPAAATIALAPRRRCDQVRPELAASEAAGR